MTAAPRAHWLRGYSGRKKLDLICYLVITLVSIFLFGGLLTGFQIFTHETPALYQRIFEYRYEFSHYGFPPALFPNGIFTGGFAFPLYYPPLSYLLTALLSRLLPTYVWATHASFFLSVVFSGYSIFWALRRIFGVSAGFVAALFYITFPYRFTDTFVRGALAESWTFFWYPIIFFGAFSILKKNYRTGVPLLALSVGGLLLTHSVVAMFFMLSVVPYFIVLGFLQKRWSAIVPVMVSAMLALGLSAWFYIPQQLLWDKVRATVPGSMLDTTDLIEAANVYFSQFFYSRPEAWSAPGNHRLYPGISGDLMSFEIGTGVLVVLLAGIAMFAFKRRRHLQSGLNLQIALLSLGVSFLLLYCVVDPRIFRSLPQSFLLIQFPYRLLGIVCFFAALFLSVAFHEIDWTRIRLHRAHAAMAIAVILVITVNPLLKVPMHIENPNDDFSRESVIAQSGNGFVILAEYLPRDFEDIAKSFTKDRKVHLEGPGVLEKAPKLTEGRRWTVNASGDCSLILPLVDYPVWKAVTAAGKTLSLESYKGLISVQIPAGRHDIRLIRTLAPGQKIGLWISSLSLLVILSIVIFYPRRKSDVISADTSEYQPLSPSGE